MLKDYKELEEERQKLAKKHLDHYNSVDLPGTRVMSTDGTSAKERIAEMKKLKDLPNHE